MNRKTVFSLCALFALRASTAQAQATEEWRSWNQPVEPFRIAENLYYVGASDIAAYLITTSAGHILIDGGFVETAPQIEANIAKLDFKPKDVKILLNSHAHFDHAAAFSALKAATGAKLFASMAGGMVGLTLAQLAPENSLWWGVWLVVAVGCFAAAGLIAWFTVRPSQWHTADQIGWIAVLLLTLATGLSLPRLSSQSDPLFWTFSALIQVGTLVSLMAFVPLFVNFWPSRFRLPWSLYALAIFALPWLYHFPLFDLALSLLWLYATLLYLLLGALTEFDRQAMTGGDSLSERERLANGFNHFLQGMFAVYEPIFGGRRLEQIQTQIVALQHNRQLEDENDLFGLADLCRTALLLAVNRLDDLAGTLFTARVGQAAYDSLPWLEAETLVRHVLSPLSWGQSLTQTFKTTHDSRADLLRQADIFAGFDNDGIEALLQMVTAVRQPPPPAARVGARYAAPGTTSAPCSASNSRSTKWWQCASFAQ